MTKLFTYIGEFLVKNIDRTTGAYAHQMEVKGGWLGAKRNRKGNYDIYYYKYFPKRTYKLHSYLRNLNEK